MGFGSWYIQYNTVDIVCIAEELFMWPTTSDFFFVLSTSILIAKVILNKENTFEAMKSINDVRVLGR